MWLIVVEEDKINVFERAAKKLNKQTDREEKNWIKIKLEYPHEKC